MVSWKENFYECELGKKIGIKELINKIEEVSNPNRHITKSSINLFEISNYTLKSIKNDYWVRSCFLFWIAFTGFFIWKILSGTIFFEILRILQKGKISFLLTKWLNYWHYILENSQIFRCDFFFTHCILQFFRLNEILVT